MGQVIGVVAARNEASESNASDVPQTLFRRTSVNIF